MKTTILTAAKLLAFIVVFDYCFSASSFFCPSSAYAQTKSDDAAALTQAQPSERPAGPAARQRMDFIKYVNCHLRDGRLVFGRLISEDKNKITIEQPQGSRIVVFDYSKREIDLRTMDMKNMPHFQYYLDLGEYFSGKTWDFIDDPDDFIQAIRCYENAKSLLESQKPGDEKLAEIQGKIEHLLADRQVWIREIASRAELKKLEFEAEFEKKLSTLEKKIDAADIKLQAGLDRINDIARDMEDQYDALAKTLTERDEDFSRRLNVLAERIQINRGLIDQLFWLHPHP